MSINMMTAPASQPKTPAKIRSDVALLFAGCIALCLANVALVLASPAFASAVALIGEY
jgi:hypothetical protein